MSASKTLTVIAVLALAGCSPTMLDSSAASTIRKMFEPNAASVEAAPVSSASTR